MMRVVFKKNLFLSWSYVVIVSTLLCGCLHGVECVTFGTVATSTLIADSTNCSQNKNNIIRGSSSCITCTSRNRKTFIDIGIVEPAHATVLVYLQKTGQSFNQSLLRISDTREPYAAIKDLNSFSHPNYTIVTSTLRAKEPFIRISDIDKAGVCLYLVRIYEGTLEEYCLCADICSRNLDPVCSGFCPQLETPSLCNRENVAFEKAAKMSSQYSGSGNASMAVNGNIGTTYSGPGYTPFQDQWNCIHTDTGDRQSWWEVDLGQSYPVVEVVIYRRSAPRARTNDAGEERMKYVQVLLDNKPCGEQFTTEQTKERITVNCTDRKTTSQVPTGQIVKLTRNVPQGEQLNHGVFLNVCEVQVWVCKDGYYGPDCTKCESGCVDQECLQENGTCTKGCINGWYRRKCNRKCSVGCVNKCDRLTGHCSCRPNWSGDNCTACDAKHYGPNCSLECGHCSNNSACDRSSGQCREGCHPGYETDYCNKSCSKNSYGAECRSHCAEGCQDRCDPETGSCLCLPGWLQGLDRRCEHACLNGTYGDKCSSQCSDGCHGGCHHVNGSCQCQPGWLQDEQQRCATKVGSLGGGSEVWVAVVATISIFIVTSVVIVVVIICRRRRKPRTESVISDRPLLNVGSQGERLYVNCGEAAAQNHSFVHEGRNSDANTVKSPFTKELDDDDLLDTMQEDLHLAEDDRWATYQTVKVTLDPMQRHLLDRLTAVDKLKAEFKKLPAGLTKPHTVGIQTANLSKNRFKRLFPYDETRVVLTPLENVPASDYINANFIANKADERAYIATQGPLKDTVGAFWRMVCQEKITQIVMLTNLQEKDKMKCHKYWPDAGNRQKYDDVTVEGTEVQMRADFFIRAFRVQKATRGSPRVVTQYHMVSWPDHGVPSALALVNLLRHVSARTRHDSGPLLVHCSAGVGRTGTYIALDMMLQEISQAQEEPVYLNQAVDVFQTTRRMREDRVLMVQTVDQYVFLQEALLEAYTSLDTRLPLASLPNLFPSPIHPARPHPHIDREYKALCQLKNFLSKPTHDVASQSDNIGKNRDVSVMADDAHMVFLSAHVTGRNQYINAVLLPSFRQQRGLIMTQLPMTDTVVDLWRLVESFNVNTVISLGSDQEEQNKDYCHYWPRSVKYPLKTGPYVVTMTSSRVLGDTYTAYDLTVQKDGKALGTGVQILHLAGWPGDLPEGTGDLLRLLGTLDTLQSQDGSSPVVVQCKDGATRSGLLCALSHVISRMTYDRELDVYLPVRQVQGSRPQAVSSQEQYRFCYQVVLEYKNNFDIYANS